MALAGLIDPVRHWMHARAAPGDSPGEGTPMSKRADLRRRAEERRRRLIQAAVIIAVLGIAGAILIVKNQPAAPLQAGAGQLPEQHLGQLMQAGVPALAFFHSNNCQQCLDMVDIVNQVYPEFKDVIGLVDVNVYDDRNTRLLETARIRVIPTLVFYDRQGQDEVFMGVMPPDDLRAKFQGLAGR
jgi:hypothetical protein